MMRILRKAKIFVVVTILLFFGINTYAQQVENALKLLEDKKSLAAMRKNAINTLVKKKELKCLPMLAAIITNTKEDEGLRKRAIIAFGELKAPEGIAPLGNVLKDSEDSYMIKPDIIVALQEIGGEAAKIVLTRAFLENLGNPIITDETLVALGKMKGKIPVEYMGPALMSDNEGVVKGTLKLIKTTRDVSALPIMMPILNKKNLELKKEVISTAILLGGSDIVPIMILRLDDKDPAFRAYLAEYLNKTPAKPMKSFYYKEFDKFIEKEEDKKVKDALIKARKKIKEK